MSSSDWWKSALTGTPLRTDADRVYYIETPEDAFADTQQDVPRHRWTKMRRSHYDWLAQELEKLPPGQKIVDIGCGQSQFRDLLDRHYACGVDFYPYPMARLVTDLNGALPLEDGSCDVAVLSNVLEHIFEPRFLLSEMNRILKPGGHMLIVVPFMIKLHQPPYDFFRYTNYALERLCSEAGFAQIRVEGVGNIFDIYDLDRNVRAKVLRRETAGFRKFMVRALLWGARKCDTFAQRQLPPGVRDAADRDGFPHSFAVHAETAA